MNKIEDKFKKPLDIKQENLKNMLNIINPFFNQLRSEINKSKTDKEKDNNQLLSLDKGILKIDFNQKDNKFNKIMQRVIDNKVDLIALLGESIIIGVGAAILYKGIVSAFKTSLNYENEIE
jgi:hypothetical protein